MPGFPSDGADDLFQRAFAHHQAGELEAAERLYRQVIERFPAHVDAQHLLGVVALQSGRLDEAARLISESLALEPRSPAAHNNLGNVFLRQNKLDDALGHFSRAVELQPGYVAAQLNLGNTLRSQGRLHESAEHLRQAVVLDPTLASAQTNLGAVLLALGDVARAVRAFEAVVELQPENPEAYAHLACALAEVDLHRALDVLDGAARLGAASPSFLEARGMVLARLGRYPEAEDAFAQALALNPDSVAALTNLGLMLRDAGDPERALEPLQRAVQLDPAAVSVQIALAQALREAGFDDDAEEQLGAMLAAHSNSALVLAYFGSLCLEREDRAGAERAWRDALSLEPDHADVLYRLGNLLMLQGRSDEATDCYRRALSADPAHGPARWALAMAQIPAIAADHAEMLRSRENFARALAELDRFFDANRVVEGNQVVGSTQPFYLAYQAEDNRALLARYGALCHRLMAPWQARHLPAAASRPQRRRVRVGFASAHLHDHSVWNAIVKGWVKNLDRRRFEICLFHLGGRQDAETEWASALADRFESGRHHLLWWARVIDEAELDVLIYPEIGMDAMTTKLASLRLAPVQAASWGHPQTTGLPTMDYFISAEDMEPANAGASYTERLVRLPKLGVCYEPVEVAPSVPDLRAPSLPADVPLLLCPGQPFKYAPEHDRVWVEISRRAAPCRLVFFKPQDSALSQHLSARLERQYRAAGLDYERHVSFIPMQNRSQFYGLMQRAHLFLDTLGFSGFNTVMQAVECGLPVVAHEGRFMRGRFGSAILRRIGLDRCVATSDEAYIDLAVALSRDQEQRTNVRRQIEDQSSVLFNDPDAVRELERFLDGVTRMASVG